MSSKSLSLIVTFTLIAAVAFPSTANLIHSAPVDVVASSAGASDLAPQQSNEAQTTLIAISDVGCKSDSVKNLKNVAVQDTPVISAGDIRYKCDADDVKALWDQIREKHGCYGNHDIEDTGSKAFVKKLFELGPLGLFTWRERGWNVGIIGMNQYINYEVNSPQYNFVKAALDRYEASPWVDWTLVCFHEPIRTPELDHGPNDKFKNIYEPLFQKYDKVIALEAHNHGVWWGEVNDVNQIGCGGGGYLGDTFGGEINGFDYVSVDPGYCLMEFFEDEVSVKHIGTDGTTVLEQGTLTK